MNFCLLFLVCIPYPSINVAYIFKLSSKGSDMYSLNSIFLVQKWYLFQPMLNKYSYTDRNRVSMFMSWSITLPWSCPSGRMTFSSGGMYRKTTVSSPLYWRPVSGANSTWPIRNRWKANVSMSGLAFYNPCLNVQYLFGGLNVMTHSHLTMLFLTGLRWLGHEKKKMGKAL